MSDPKCPDCGLRSPRMTIHQQGCQRASPAAPAFKVGDYVKSSGNPACLYRVRSVDEAAGFVGAKYVERGGSYSEADYAAHIDALRLATATECAEWGVSPSRAPGFRVGDIAIGTYGNIYRVTAAGSESKVRVVPLHLGSPSTSYEVGVESWAAQSCLRLATMAERAAAGLGPDGEPLAKTIPPEPGFENCQKAAVTVQEWASEQRRAGVFGLREKIDAAIAKIQAKQREYERCVGYSDRALRVAASRSCNCSGDYGQHAATCPASVRSYFPAAGFVPTTPTTTPPSRQADRTDAYATAAAADLGHDRIAALVVKGSDMDGAYDYCTRCHEYGRGTWSPMLHKRFCPIGRALGHRVRTW